MKILLTGAAGFIGRHVSSRLEAHDVFGVDSFEPRVHGPRNHEAHFVSGIMRRRSGFIFEHEMEGTETLVHLAAQVGVADSMKDPLRYVLENTTDTAHLLERLIQMKAPPKRLVVASSMSVYGDPKTQDPVAETHPIEPTSVYGLTKDDQERLFMMAGDILGIPVVALRFFNVYGPGQALHNPYTGVLANFANWILQGKNPIVYEDGLQTRDFIYVEDVADVVATAATSEAFPGGIYNVCTGSPSTIYDVARFMAKALEAPRLAPHVTHEKRPGDIRHCVGDASKLKAVMPGWKPRSLEAGLRSYASHLLQASPAPTPPPPSLDTAPR